MSLRRRSSSKPSLSRGYNKVWLTNRHDVVEIESWVDFVSKNDSDNEEQFSFPSLRKKEESKESVYEKWERMKKDMQNHCINRHLKSNCLQNLSNSLMELCYNLANKNNFINSNYLFVNSERVFTNRQFAQVILPDSPFSGFRCTNQRLVYLGVRLHSILSTGSTYHYSTVL